MRIKNIFAAKRPVISFEIFPPKSGDVIGIISGTLGRLKKLGPDFISITYGAGGSTRENTVKIASLAKNRFKMEVLPHLTCVGHTAQEIDDILGALQAEGIENVLALRGDPPSNSENFDYGANEFKYAVDLVRYIKSKTDMCVGAAAYPEGHVQSKRLSTDLAYLKQKVDAGVDFLITQLFFDNRVFYNFLENARRIGIECPISAGILPVLNAHQVRRISSLCGASFPAKLLMIIEEHANDPKEMERAGIEYASQQVQDLLDNGVDGVHLYTLNRTEPIAEILRNVGLVNGDLQRHAHV